MNDPRPDPDAQLDALFAQARAQRPDTSTAEYAFETRLLARLRESNRTETVWATVSWRLMPFFAACVIGLAIWHDYAATAATDAATVSSADHPEMVDLVGGFN
jgi:hypothetical protein